MTPIDPVQLASEDPRPPMAPPYVDENPNLASVRQGMNVAENEKRKLVADEYESVARDLDNASEALDDIDRTLSEGGEEAPELDAIHTIGPEDRS
jgi:hypothetical protein